MKTDIKTTQELIELLSDYPSHFWWDEWNNFKGVADIEPLLKRFRATYGELSPREAALQYIQGYLCLWEYTPEKFQDILPRLTPGAPSLFEGEGRTEVFHFQCGTSKTRARHFIESGLGFVLLENRIGSPEWEFVDQHFGLQVSERGDKTSGRGGYNRLEYYATCQGDKFLHDEPVILIGDIDPSHVYRERNGGEYAISTRDFDKIENPRILTLGGYLLEFGC